MLLVVGLVTENKLINLKLDKVLYFMFLTPISASTVDFEFLDEQLTIRNVTVKLFSQA